MKKLMKQLFPVSIALMLLCATAQGQFLKKVGDAAKGAAENATIRKANQKTDEAVSKGIDKATDPHTYKDKGEGTNDDAHKTSTGENNQASTGGGHENASGGVSTSLNDHADVPQGAKAAEMAYAKSDFVPGDEIIFDDPMDNEKLGEFPSQWDLLRGNAEVAAANGKKALELTTGGDAVIPLMKNPRNFLGDVFTVEFDFLSVKAKNADKGTVFMLDFYGADNKDGGGWPLMRFEKRVNVGNDKRYNYSWSSSSSDNNPGGGEVDLTFDTWHHFAMSFNKRAWKVYINGVRVANVPNVKAAPGWFKLSIYSYEDMSLLFTNWRIAKGAVPLYDRLASEGKIITYGITFDVGKSTIKPESMSEINRIAQLMKDNPSLKFSVEGHTDNTGNAASNQTLSEARSKAVMDKLVEMGISNDRLKSAGKGQTSPIADNSTDEGRAKNRRVEFVKI